jgi:hypothetical protein
VRPSARFIAAISCIFWGILLPLPVKATEPPGPPPLFSCYSQGQHLVWTEDDLQVTGTGTPPPVVYSFREAMLAVCTQAEDQSSEIDVAPVSWVGPLLTLRTYSYRQAKGASTHDLRSSMQTIDLRDPGKPVGLKDWFEPTAARLAVLKVPLVAFALKELHAAPAGNLLGLGTQLGRWTGDCRYGFTPDFVDHFAFHHRQGAKVDLQIGLSHGCSASAGYFSELTATVPIPPALDQALTDAQTGKHGFLAEHRPLLPSGKRSHVDYERVVAP